MGTPALTGGPALRAVMIGPLVTASKITFSVPDRDDVLAGVELLQEIQRPRLGPSFSRNAAGTWILEWPRPDCDRFEYQLRLRYTDGHEEVLCDPSNPLRAPGPFGDKSVIELPAYRAPAWLEAEPAIHGDIAETSIASRALRARFPTILWTPPGYDPSEPLPLLIAHDGPEFAEYSGLIHLLEVGAEQRRIPPLRAALIAPVDRNQIYSASAAYARSIAHEILPALDEIAPAPHGRSARIGIGASLGALALLHVHRMFPATFGALFLQSGSFFRQRYDPQESGFVRFGRITRFVGKVLNAGDWPQPIAVTMTCGSVEENLANNRAMNAALAHQGYDTYLHEYRDAHNWVAWRDTMDPHLVDLIGKVWG